jgi:hypothetical protein
MNIEGATHPSEKSDFYLGESWKKSDFYRQGAWHLSRTGTLFRCLANVMSSICCSFDWLDKRILNEAGDVQASRGCRLPCVPAPC